MAATLARFPGATSGSPNTSSEFAGGVVVLPEAFGAWRTAEAGADADAQPPTAQRAQLGST